MAGKLFGSIQPRLATEPLRKLTEKTSRGFAMCAWARENLPFQLQPHQEELFKRGLELLPGGREYRFRVILVCAGRQGGGKSTSAMALAAWRMVEDNARLVAVTSAQRDAAREFWLRLLDTAQDSPGLSRHLHSVRRATGGESMGLGVGRMKILTSNDRSARGLSLDLGLVDELRTHENFEAWSAILPTIIARRNGQIWAFSNAGTDQSLVLNQLRASALAGTDPGTGIFEWSAPPGSDLDDVTAWQAALPAMGRLVPEAAIRSALASMPGNQFRAEYLCERVVALNSLVDMDAFADCGDPAGSLTSSRERVCAGLDVAPGNGHVTLAAAAVQPDGRCRVEIVGAWTSPQDARAELGELLDRVRPRVLHAAPGPTVAALGAELRECKAFGKPLTVAETADACGALVEQISSRRLLHNHDPLLATHLSAAQRVPVGTGFRFGSAPGQHIDAAYAVGLAVHGARSQVRGGTLRLVTAVSA